MSDSAILKMYSGLPPHIERAPGGYSMMPRQVIRDEGLSQGEKVLLAAIIGMCYGDERRINATIDEIAGQAGMSVNSVRRFLPGLIKAQLITRRPDPERIGGPWLTVVTCDPKGFQLSNTPENWRVKRVVDNRTPPTPEVRTPLRRFGGGTL